MAVNCYTFKMELIVQVLASDENLANEMLEKGMGSIADRTVNLKDVVEVYPSDNNASLE
jgi:hypothetical protein